MAVVVYNISKERHPGGITTYTVMIGSFVRRPDAKDPKELGKMLYEMVRNDIPLDGMKVRLVFEHVIVGHVSASETGSDYLSLPLTSDEAFEVISAYSFFKSEVGMKERQDARRVKT